MTGATSRRGTARSRRRKDRPQATDGGEPAGFYAALLTGDERKRLAQPVSLDDELKLVRSRVHRLAREIDAQGQAGDDPKALQALVVMVRAIAALERARSQARGKDGSLIEAILQVLKNIDPHEQL